MKKIISLAIALCLMLTVCSTGLMSLTAAAAQTIEGSEVTWSFDNITNVMIITQLKADLVASEAEEEE